MYALWRPCSRTRTSCAALADALHFGLVQRVCFVLVVLLLGKHLVIKSYLFGKLAQETLLQKVALQLPHQPPRDGLHPAVRLLCLLSDLRVVAKTLVAGQPLHLPLVALTQRKSQLCVYLQAAADDLLGQLGICREGDVLLLHGRVDE